MASNLTYKATLRVFDEDGDIIDTFPIKALDEDDARQKAEKITEGVRNAAYYELIPLPEGEEG